MFTRVSNQLIGPNSTKDSANDYDLVRSIDAKSTHFLLKAPFSYLSSQEKEV